MPVESAERAATDCSSTRRRRGQQLERGAGRGRRVGERDGAPGRLRPRLLSAGARAGAAQRPGLVGGRRGPVASAAVTALLTATETAEAPAAFVRRHGAVVATFDHRTQDSGNVSWLVATPAGALFVKTAGVPGPPPRGAPVPYLDHAGRVALLRNAVALARSCAHPALARLRNVVEFPLGPLLVYDRAPGELVATPGPAPRTRARRTSGSPASRRRASWASSTPSSTSTSGSRVRAGWRPTSTTAACWSSSPRAA